jgi:hypothetical protein
MSHTIANWDPEDTVAWEAGNKNIARPLHAGHRDVRRSQLDDVLTAATVKV